MCVAITMMPGAEITEDEVIKMGRANADGVGVAWVHNGQVHWQKAVKYSTAYVARLVNSWVGVPRLVHFRLSTAGGTRPDLCHPFEIGPYAKCDPVGSSDRVMIHNGHWGQWDQLFRLLKDQDPNLLPDAGPWSDTRLAAYLSHTDPDWLNILGGRVAVMNGEGQVTHLGDWSDLREGMRVSNFHWNTDSGYKRGGYSGYRGWKGWEWESEDWQAFEAEKAQVAKDKREASIKDAQARRDAIKADINKQNTELATVAKGTTHVTTVKNGAVTYSQSQEARWAEIERKRQLREGGGAVCEVLSSEDTKPVPYVPTSPGVSLAAAQPGALANIVGRQLTRGQRKFFNRYRETGTGAWDTRPWKNPVSQRVYQVGANGSVVEIAPESAPAGAIEELYYDDGHGDGFWEDSGINFLEVNEVGGSD